MKTPTMYPYITLLVFPMAFVVATASSIHTRTGKREQGRLHYCNNLTPLLQPEAHAEGHYRLHLHDVDHLDGQYDYILCTSSQSTVLSLRGGIRFIPAGYNPFGYKITELGLEFLAFDGSLDSDVGRFLASLKKKRITTATLKDSWLEIVRNAKTAQAMRIYRNLDVLVEFCLKAGLID